MEAARRASPDYGLAPHQHHDDHHHRGRRRTRSRSRSRSRSPQGGSRAQHRAAPSSRRRRRASPPPPSAARRQDELERAARTVLAHSLPVRAGERELFEFFRAAGRVTDVRVIYDRARRSRGIAYVEFASADEAAAALALAGAPLMGVPVQVRPPEAEKNAAWEAARAARRAAGGQPMSAAEVAAVLGAAGMARPPRPALAEVQAAGGGAAAEAAAAAATTAGPSITLRVSGLPAALRGSEVREMFGVFGALQSVLVEAAAGATTTPTDDDGGVVATLTFAVRQEGLQALEHWNGQELLGRALEVVEVADVAAAGDGVAGVAGAALPAAAGALDAEAAAAMVRAMAAPKAAAVAGVGGDAATADAAAALPPPPPPTAAAASLSDPVAAAEAAAAAAASVAAAAAAAAAQPKTRELDEESAGFRLTGQARVDLMRRLGGGAAADLAPPPAVAAPQPAAAVVPVVASAAPPSPSRAATGSLVGPAVIPGPTRCLLLRNMFGTPEEAEQADGPDWPSLLEQDARDACEQAFPSAPPDHVFVDARGGSGGSDDAGGCVYARLPTAEAAAAAQRMLHGRFYAGRVVAAAFQDEAAYARRFGLQP
jgi:RNA-binding protein 39